MQKVYLLDGSHEEVRVAQGATTKDVVLQMMKVLGMSAESAGLQICFGLCRWSDASTMEPAGDAEDALDLFSSCKVVFKIIALNEMCIKSSDPAVVAIRFKQAVHEVLQGLYVCTWDELMDLSALQMQAMFGLYEKSTHSEAFVIRRLLEIVPLEALQGRRGSEVAAIVLTRWRSLALQSLDPRKQYLGIVQKLPLYGATVFHTRVRGLRGSLSEKKTYLVAVGLKGLSFCEQDDICEELLLVEWDKLLSWGVRKKHGLFLRVKSASNQTMAWLDADVSTYSLCACISRTALSIAHSHSLLHLQRQSVLASKPLVTPFSDSKYETHSRDSRSEDVSPENAIPKEESRLDSAAEESSDAVQERETASTMDDNVEDVYKRDDMHAGGEHSDEATDDEDVSEDQTSKSQDEDQNERSNTAEESDFQVQVHDVKADSIAEPSAGLKNHYDEEGMTSKRAESSSDVSDIRNEVHDVKSSSIAESSVDLKNHYDEESMTSKRAESSSDVSDIQNEVRDAKASSITESPSEGARDSHVESADLMESQKEVSSQRSIEQRQSSTSHASEPDLKPEEKTEQLELPQTVLETDTNKVDEENEDEQKRAKEEANAATRMQAAVRGGLERKRLSKRQLEEREYKAAVFLQALARGVLERKRVDELVLAIQLQALWRGYRVRKQQNESAQPQQTTGQKPDQESEESEEEQVEEVEEDEEQVEDDPLNKLSEREVALIVEFQAAVRGYLARREFEDMEKDVAATYLQAISRGILARKRYEAIRSRGHSQNSQSSHTLHNGLGIGPPPGLENVAKKKEKDKKVSIRPPAPPPPAPKAPPPPLVPPPGLQVPNRSGPGHRESQEKLFLNPREEEGDEAGVMVIPPPPRLPPPSLPHQDQPMFLAPSPPPFPPPGLVDLDDEVDRMSIPSPPSSPPPETRKFAKPRPPSSPPPEEGISEDDDDDDSEFAV